MKFQKGFLLRVLGPRNYIWITWVKKTDQAATRAPYHQFLDAGPHFSQN